MRPDYKPKTLPKNGGRIGLKSAVGEKAYQKRMGGIISKVRISSESHEYFYHDECARQLLRRVRWHGTPSCPRCGSVDVRDVLSERIVEGLSCRSCGYNFSTTAGSYFQGSRIGLHEQLRFILTRELEPRSSAGRFARIFRWKTTTVSRQLAKLPPKAQIEFAWKLENYMAPEGFGSVQDFLEQDGIGFSLELFEQHLTRFFVSELAKKDHSGPRRKAFAPKPSSEILTSTIREEVPTSSHQWVAPSSVPYLSDGERARHLAISLHWKHGVPRCPKCLSNDIRRINSRTKREIYRCHTCGRGFNPLVDTIFARSKMPTHRFLQFFVLHNALGDSITRQEICYAIHCTPKTADLWLKRARRIGYPYNFAAARKDMSLNFQREAHVEDNFFFLCDLKGIMVDEMKLQQFLKMVVQ